MASELRKKTQDAIDGMREDVAGCELAMLIDRDTGLVLAKSSEKAVPQNRLDQLSASARTELSGSLVTALSDLTSDGDIFTALYVGKKEVVAVVSSVNHREDALVCEFSDIPVRADLLKAASTVFNISDAAEAA